MTVTVEDAIKAIQDGTWASEDVLLTLMRWEDEVGEEWVRVYGQLEGCKRVKLYAKARKAFERRTAGPSGAVLRVADADTPPPNLGELLDYAVVEKHAPPRDYLVTMEGVQHGRETKDGMVWEEVCRAPVLVTESLRSVRTGEAMVTVSWWTGDGWSDTVVSRACIADARELLRAMGKLDGFPVHTRNSSALAAYLVEYAAANRDALGRGVFYDRFGWVGRECNEFTLVDVRSDNPVVKAVSCGGSADAWAAMCTRIVDSPMMLAGLCTSVAAVLAGPLRTEKLITDCSGRTSTGKSTLLYAAASVWGYPGVSGDPGFISSWNNSRQAFAELSNLVGDLPLILDESKLATEGLPHFVIHTLVDGISRQRSGATGGAYTSGATGSTVISTGESPLFDMKGVGEGAATRCLALTGDASARLDGMPRFSTADVGTIKRTFCEHYGWLGRTLVWWWLQDVDARKEWLGLEYTRCVVKVNGLLDAAGMYQLESGVRGRIAGRLALLMTAWIVVREVWPFTTDLPVPDVGDDHWMGIIAMMASSGAESASAKWVDALRMFRSEVLQACSTQYWRAGGELHPPMGGWLGRWIDLDGRQVQASLPRAIDMFCKEKGLNRAEITRAWAASGALVAPQRDRGRNTLLDEGIGGLGRARYWVLDPEFSEFDE